MKWQRRARLILAAVAVISAAAVAVSLRPRPSTRRDTPVERSDPKATVESAGGHEIRINREREEVRVNYDKLLTYPDGTSKMVGVTVVTERAGGRIFRI